MGRGLRDLGLPDSTEIRERLVEYMELVTKWGRVHNLIALRDPPSMVSTHVLDSLAAAHHILGGTVLDVGSGAGLPGLPLAIVMPDLEVTLLDSREKRVRFLRYAVGALELHNVDVACGRVEQYRPPQKFDTLVTRAFSTIAAFTEMAGHLCCPRGRLIALKGRYPDAELAEVDRDRFEVTAVYPVVVPGLDAQRHIVVLTPKQQRSR